jgi:hypothetical protein
MEYNSNLVDPYILVEACKHELVSQFFYWNLNFNLKLNICIKLNKEKHIGERCVKAKNFKVTQVA